MNSGPGDDILIDLESGTADKDIQSKYKINNDQLKAFKSLHYGLSNKEMSYDDIGSYYPDINSFFKEEPKTSAQQPGKSVIERPDFTKPVHEKAISESTARTVPQAQYNQAAAESHKPVISLQQKFDQKAKQGMQDVTHALHNNDDVIKDVIRQHRYTQDRENKMTDFANAPRSDMPTASVLANARNLLPKETTPENQPITDEEFNQAKESIVNDPGKARQFINQVSVHKPDQAAKLQSSMYMLDAAERLKKDPEGVGLKVNDNLNKLEKGELKYNSVTGELQKELGPIDALVSGVKEHTRQMGNYDIYQGSNKDVANLLDKRMAEYDPDKPVEIPKGFSEITQMAGMEWSALLKGMAVGAVTSLVPGGEAATPYISAAVNAPEYYKRGYSTALEESYSEARKMGKSQEEAMKIARDQAKTEGNLGALEGGISAFVGGRIGLKELPKFNITGGFKNAAAQLLKHSVHFAAETSIEGLADGLTAGYLQGLKDEAAEKKGLFRDSEKSIRDNITGELTFSLAMGAMTHAGRKLVDPDTFKKLKYYLGKQDQNVVQSSLGNLVMTGQINKEDADNITQELKQQKEIDDKIPADIKDVSRMAMHDKIAERNELQAKLETTDEALHPEIKEQIKKLNEEIAEHSTHKKSENEIETEAKTQADAEAQANGTGIEPGPEDTSQPVAETQQGVGGESAPVADNSKQTQNEQPEMQRPQVDDPKLQSELDDVVDKELKLYKIHTKRQFAKALDFGKVPTEGSERIKYLKYRNAYLDTVLTKLEYHPQAGNSEEWHSLHEKLEDEYDANEAELYAKGEIKSISKKDNKEAGDIHYTNSDGNQYMLRDDRLFRVAQDGTITPFSDKGMSTPATQELVAKIKESNQSTQTNQNAIPEQGPEGVHVPASSGDSQEMGEGNEGQRAVNEETADKEELEINSIDDLDKALQSLKSPNKVEQQTQDEELKGMANRQPLPKLTESNQGSNVPVNSDVKAYTPQSIIEKAKETFKGDPLIERAANFLEPLIKANPNIKINHDAKVPNNVYGYSHPDGSIDLNFHNHPNEGALLQTGLHEMIHAVTRSEIENNKAFRGEIDDALSKVREKMGLPDSDSAVTTIMHYLSAAGKMDESKYGASNAHELIAEVFTNKSFRDQLASIKYEGDTFLKKIYQIIAKYLSEAYNNLVGAKKSIQADDLAEFIQQLTEKTVTGKQGEDQAGALGMMAPQSQEDAIKSIIKRTPKSITDDQLKERIVAATGMDENQVQDLIDEVRKPVVPPKPVVPTSVLTKEERQVSLNKIKKALNPPKAKEQSKFSKFWEGVKNGSAWMDNPYRFITKITEDINKHYGLENKEAIPLGRQFEKSASGRAALKIDSFVNEIVRGNINGEKLGKLTGEKYNDFQTYLFSQRVIDRLNKQEEKLKAGEESNRQTGNVTRQDAEVALEELTKKYGNLDDFKKRGEAFQKHMDTMLQTLVASGILSKESYDQIKADNDFYAPFSVVQSKLLAGQDKQPVGISGVIKRVKGIDYDLIKSKKKALSAIDALGGALQENIISPEEYFNTSFQILNDLKNDGKITEEEYNKHIASLENPGFAINDILDAGANMIYKAEGMALKNTMMQRLFAYKASDPDGLFIQDVDGFKATTTPGGETRMVAKPLDQIKVEPGMAPIKLRIDGKDKIVAVNKNAAAKLNDMSNYETSSLMQVADVINKIFRTSVITLSPGFQAVNFMIDFTRTAMLSRYGPLAGKGLTQPIVNAALFMPQYIEALLHSALGNVGYKTETYKQWMNSDSFSKGMFDNLFDNEKRIKEVSASTAKRILSNFINLHWIEVPGSILEQTHKIATHQRGLSVEGFEPKMMTAMLASMINENLKFDMSAQELKEGMDRLNYEVQNFAGSPNFPETHKYMKMASMFLQFFSARVKGEMTDYRRVANLFSTLTPGVKSGKGEGVKLSKQDALQMGAQFLGAAGMIAAYAIRNNHKDEDEKEFDGIAPYHQDNYLNIPLGYFEYTDEDGNTQKLRDYAKIPLRGLTATMNVVANSFVKFMKRKNPDEFKKMAEAFAGNASPVNLNGKDERELGESLASNLTPVFKYLIEYSFNRDTHNHRDIIPEFVQNKGMLSKYRKGLLKPWEVATKKTPQWAKDMSKYIYDNLGIRISAIELDHMENTMGNPTELYEKSVKKRLVRSEAKYPLYKPKSEEKNTSSATVTPVTDNK